MNEKNGVNFLPTRHLGHYRQTQKPGTTPPLGISVDGGKNWLFPGDDNAVQLMFASPQNIDESVRVTLTRDGMDMDLINVMDSAPFLVASLSVPHSETATQIARIGKDEEEGEKRIIGSFVVQGYTLFREPVDIQRLSFDATDAVLAMSLDEIHGLVDDGSETTEMVALSALSEKLGASIDTEDLEAFYINLEEAVCAYFEVDDVTEITEEMLGDRSVQRMSMD